MNAKKKWTLHIQRKKLKHGPSQSVDLVSLASLFIDQFWNNRTACGPTVVVLYILYACMHACLTCSAEMNSSISRPIVMYKQCLYNVNKRNPSNFYDGTTSNANFELLYVSSKILIDLQHLVIQVLQPVKDLKRWNNVQYNNGQHWNFEVEVSILIEQFLFSHWPCTISQYSQIKHEKIYDLWKRAIYENAIQLCYI